MVWRCLPDKLTSFGGSYNLFRSLYGSKGAKDTFWLDRRVYIHAHCCTVE